jgi:hypothetical protein
MIADVWAIARAMPGIIRGINLVADKLNSIQLTQEKIMSELDDAKAAMTALTDAVGAGTAEITGLVNKIVALLGAPAGVDPVAVEALATQMQAEATAMNTSVATAKAAAGV